MNAFSLFAYPKFKTESNTEEIAFVVRKTATANLQVKNSSDYDIGAGVISRGLGSPQHFCLGFAVQCVLTMRSKCFVLL